MFRKLLACFTALAVMITMAIPVASFAEGGNVEPTQETVGTVNFICGNETLGTLEDVEVLINGESFGIQPNSLFLQCFEEEENTPASHNALMYYISKVDSVQADPYGFDNNWSECSMNDLEEIWGNVSDLEDDVLNIYLSKFRHSRTVKVYDKDTETYLGKNSDYGKYWTLDSLDSKDRINIYGFYDSGTRSTLRKGALDRIEIGDVNNGGKTVRGTWKIDYSDMFLGDIKVYLDTSNVSEYKGYGTFLFETYYDGEKVNDMLPDYDKALLDNLLPKDTTVCLLDWIKDTAYFEDLGNLGEDYQLRITYGSRHKNNGTEKTTEVINSWNIDTSYLSSNPDSYYSIISIEVVVTPVDITELSVSGDESCNYDGQEHCFTVESTPSDAVDVVYKDAEGTVCAEVCDAGVYTVTITPKFGYAHETVERTLTINPAACDGSLFTVKPVTVTYNGKAHKADVACSNFSFAYSLKYKNTATGKITTAAPVSAGTYEVYAAVNDSNVEKGTVLLGGKVIIKKAAQTVKITSTSRTFKYSAVKKGAVTASALAVSGAKGTKTFSKVSGSKYLTISKAGKITVKKGTKKGTYSIKVKVTSGETANYKAGTSAIKTIKVSVK